MHWVFSLIFLFKYYECRHLMKKIFALTLGLVFLVSSTSSFATKEDAGNCMINNGNPNNPYFMEYMSISLAYLEKRIPINDARLKSMKLGERANEDCARNVQNACDFGKLIMKCMQYY